ncbi:hypothetical protein D3C72_1360080 [compost metagenome]
MERLFERNRFDLFASRHWSKLWLLFRLGAAKLKHWAKAAEASDDWLVGLGIESDIAGCTHGTAVDTTRLSNKLVERIVEALEHYVAF